MQTETITFSELRRRVQAGQPVTISTPEGFRPVTHFHENGVQQVVRLNGSLELTRDHRLYRPNGSIVTVAELALGDEVLSDQDVPVALSSIEELGEMPVSDITVDDPKHRYYASGFSVKNCDNFTEVKAITATAGQSGKEMGATHMHLITQHRRDSEPYQKLLVEVRVEPGKFAAVPTRWFRYATTRAILRAGNGTELVEPFIAERFIHSRQGYRLKSDTFKSILGGSLLLEMSFNRLHNFDAEYVQMLMDRVNQYTTPGWSIANIVLKDGDFILKNNLEYALTTYRFDSRKVNQQHANLDFLQKRIEAFFSGAKLKYKSQSASGRFTTKTEIKDYDKTKVAFMSAGVGRNRYETVLRVIGKVEDSHPLIFLAGLLGAESGPKGYTALYGTDVTIEGFYKRSVTTTNLFDMFVEEEGHNDSSTSCPCCGGQKLLNIVSGRPFGNMPYEQDKYLMKKYNNIPVCQECFSEGAS